MNAEGSSALYGYGYIITCMYQTRSHSTGIHLFSPVNGIILCFWFQGGNLNYGVRGASYYNRN